MSNADRYTLETPENVEVDFELAGLGSRFCAMLIDCLLIGLIALVLIILLIVTGVVLFSFERGSFMASRAGPWLQAVVLVIVMTIIFNGYFIFFEWLMRGQTPGKKAMKVRVLRDDGTPVTVNEILVRNLLRLVDFLPAAYAIGAIVMFCNPLCKRLGDIAAGTIVVKEGNLDYRAIADKKYRLEASTFAPLNSELTAEERRVLNGFLQRRIELLPEARRSLADRVAGPLYVKYGGSFIDAENYLERLAEGRHYESERLA